jgi:hypothetical protein
MYITLYLSGILLVYKYKYYYQIRALHEGKTTIYLYPTITTYLVLCKPCIVPILPKPVFHLYYDRKVISSWTPEMPKALKCEKKSTQRFAEN